MHTLSQGPFVPLPHADRANLRHPWPDREVATPFDVSVCIANWNCKEYLRACLASLQQNPQDIRLEIIVVDNASTDGAADMVAYEFPDVILVRNKKNVGFARASNQAADQGSGRYVFFLNNDTVVPPYALAELVRYADTHPNAGMVGPRLRDGNGKPQISFRRTPSLAAMLHRTALLNWTGIFKRGYEDYRRNHFEPNEERQVEVLMGAAVLMPRALFQSCGRWDEDFRFGVEDVELSVRVGRSKELMYVPHIEIIHHGRLSSRSNVTFAAPNLLIGYVHFFRKSGFSRGAILAYKFVLTLDTPIRTVVKGLQYLWRRAQGRRKEADRSRLAARGLLHFFFRDLGRFWRA